MDDDDDGSDGETGGGRGRAPMGGRKGKQLTMRYVVL